MPEQEVNPFAEIENTGQPENTQNTPKDRLKEITEGIEQGIKDLFASDRYAEYLRVMSRFHHYSVNNTMLIFMQKPDASLVAGFNKWKDFKRHVLKGAKSIKIIAPIPHTITKEREKRDPDTGFLVVDDQGNPVMEKVTIQIPRFKVVPVFDVSQTEGAPLPTMVHDLHDSVEHYDAFYEAVLRSSPVPIDMEPISPEKGDGYFSLTDNRIVLRDGMSESQTICAAIHEMTHAKLHNTDALAAFQAENPEHKPKDRATQEVEAESVSYAVCQYYGIETADNSFGYIASWSKGRELKELKSSLETISHTANAIISEIDRNLAEIMSERGLQPLTQEIPGEQPPFDAQPEITSGQETREIISASVIPSDQLMPDCGVALTMQDLWDYGYQENDLLPLTKEKAYALFDEDMAIYALYENGSADMVIDHGEITAHPGYFGIERDDWKQSRDYRNTLARHDAETVQLEQAFLSHADEPAVMIYQHRDQENRSALQFLSMDELQKTGQAVDRGNYEPIYAMTLLPSGKSRDDVLESVFEQFNQNRPEDFKGHSLSVSDVVALKMNGAVTFHYVDSVGFQKIDGFLPDNPLKNAEMAMEDDYGMIDGIINNGKNLALEEQKEQMVAKQPPLPFREQLKRAQERHQAQQPKRPHPAHDRKKDMAL